MKNKIFLFVNIIIIDLLIVGCETKEEEDLLEVKACFSYTYEGEPFWEMYLAFSNCSQNANTYLWDFGDGTTSAEENPIHYYTGDGAFIISLTASNESSSDMISDTVLVDWTMVKKPNIYLYPDKNIDICITLEFPLGGQILTSIPEYNTGWCIFVDTLGKINNHYEYLFYESIQPDIWQYKEGWCVKKDDVKEFFETNMKNYNFSNKEIKDFTDYWIPRLVDYEFYTVYPQHNSLIEQVVQLSFSIKPDNLYRLFYVIIGTNVYEEIPEPKTKKIIRDGFTVVEWGVIRK